MRYAETYDSRTALAHRRDLDDGEELDEPPFVAAPNLDAIGSFQEQLTVYPNRLLFYNMQPLPLDIAVPTPPPHSDAWTFANGAYQVRFDPRDRAGTTLLAAATKSYRAAHPGWLLVRVRFDPATNLPREVELEDAARDEFTLTYETEAGHQVLAHAELQGIAHLTPGGRSIAALDAVPLRAAATYSGYAFSEAPRTSALVAFDAEAGAAWQAVSLAAGAAFLRSPPAIAYRLRIDEHDSTAGTRGFEVVIRYDTRNGVAHVHDSAGREDADEPPFLAAPNLDALAPFNAVVWMAPGDRASFSAAQRVPVVGEPDLGGDLEFARFDPADPSHATLVLTSPGGGALEKHAWAVVKVRFDRPSMQPRRSSCATATARPSRSSIRSSTTSWSWLTGRTTAR